MLEVEGHRIGVLHIQTRILVNDIHEEILGICLVFRSGNGIGQGSVIFAKVLAFIRCFARIHRKELGGGGSTDLLNTPTNGASGQSTSRSRFSNRHSADGIVGILEIDRSTCIDGYMTIDGQCGLGVKLIEVVHREFHNTRTLRNRCGFFLVAGDKGRCGEGRKEKETFH